MKNTKTYIVAFSDILGFSDIIETDDKDNNSILLNKISDIIDIVIDFLKNNPNYREKAFIQWKDELILKSFSDCFCIAIPLEFNLIPFDEHIKLFYQHIALFQSEFFRNGFLLRGGISVGSFFCNDNIIFSKALVDAHKIETKAIFPRIIVSSSFLTAIKNLKIDYKINMFMNELSVTFINPFNWKLIDAKEANDMLEKLLGENGRIEGDYYETAKQEKRKLIKEIILKCNDYIVSNPMKEIYVINKYKWLIEFCNYELSKSAKRFEKYKNEI